MSLATEETKTVTRWCGTDGTSYTSKRWAEINSIASITGINHDLEDLDKFLKQLVTDPILKDWLLEQLAVKLKPALDVQQEIWDAMSQFCGRVTVTTPRMVAALQDQGPVVLMDVISAAITCYAIPNTDAIIQDLPSKLKDCYNKRDWSRIGERKMLETIGILLQQDGYQLIKK